MIKLTTFAVMCKAYGGEPSVDLLRSFLNLGRAGDWLTLSSRGGTDVPKALTKLGGLDENRSSMKYVNNEALVINAEPISAVHPLDITKNIMDSLGKRSKVAGKRKAVVGSHGEDPHRKARKVPAQASKVADDTSTPLDVDSDPDIHDKPDPSTACNFTSIKELKDATDCYWVVAHVTPPSWKQYLREISIEHLCDIHENAYLRQAPEHPVILFKKGKSKEIKRMQRWRKKYNESLQDLDKNPLVSNMHAKIETLQSRVNGLYSKYSRLILEEKKWINYEQTLSTLRAKVEDLESKGKRLKASEIQL
ncbi:hypothetical protein Tco_1029113 [Tanacetum coccineum]|uniref:Uncharacterized protein n=1 Tax=Tanacetum coccineum TaxID=301880 RepID=A0ABQ5G2J3_9ASTR